MLALGRYLFVKNTSKVDEFIKVSLNESVLTAFWLDLSGHALPHLTGQVIYPDVILLLTDWKVRTCCSTQVKLALEHMPCNRACPNQTA